MNFNFWLLLAVGVVGAVFGAVCVCLAIWYSERERADG